MTGSLTPSKEDGSIGGLGHRVTLAWGNDKPRGSFDPGDVICQTRTSLLRNP
jgi:hypothetical protein